MAFTEMKLSMYSVMRTQDYRVQSTIYIPQGGAVVEFHVKFLSSPMKWDIVDLTP